MVLGRLKEHSLYSKLLKGVNELPESNTPNSKKIQSVAILTTDEISSKIDFSKVIKNEFKEVLQVYVYSFRKYKKSDSISYKHFTRKYFYWSGNIKEPSFESFIENPFDLLISYFNEQHLYLEYASLKSNAAFKVGFSNVNDKIFNIVINSDEKEVDKFVAVLSKYLTILNKI